MTERRKPFTTGPDRELNVTGKRFKIISVDVKSKLVLLSKAALDF